MRFIYGAFFGSFIATALATTVCSAWFKPTVESYPEFRQVCQENVQVTSECNRLRYQLAELQTKLQLDTLRRSQRDPVNPAGKAVGGEDLIPAPGEPLPLPVRPVNPAGKDVPLCDEHRGGLKPNDKDDMNDNGHSPLIEGEEEDMATATKSTALAKSPGATLALNSVAELRELADMLYKGGLQPPGIDNPNKVAAVILAGLEVGLPPTQALGSIMLTNGRLSIYGDGAMALVRASGLLENIAEIVTGTGEERHATCEVKRKSEPAKAFTFSMADANRAGLIERAKGKGPWATYPDRMLIARARGFAFRDVFPDVLRGLITYEESQDISADASVVNTEVKVTGFTADARQVPTATITPTSTVAESVIRNESAVQVGQLEASPTGPAPQPASLTGPITDAQKAEFLTLHKLVMAAKALTDKAAQRAAWEQELAPYGVSSMNQMDAATAARAIAEIGRKHDPFGHPTGATSSLTT